MPPTVGDKASASPHTYKLGCVALQLEDICLLLFMVNPGLTEVDDVSPLDGGINLEIIYVQLQPGDVEGHHLDFASGGLVPLSRVLVQGPRGDSLDLIKYLTKIAIYNFVRY